MNPESLKHRGTEAAEEIEKLVNSSAADFLISSAVGALVCSCSRKADAQAQSSLRRVAEDMEINEISSQILAAAFKVHTAIGPGVLESVYQTCLHHELRKAGLGVEAQVAVPVHYDGLRMESGYRIDLLVEDTVIVEIKCVDALLPIHKAQLLTYLKLANKPLGLLLNFNVVHMREESNAFSIIDIAEMRSPPQDQHSRRIRNRNFPLITLFLCVSKVLGFIARQY